MASSTFRHRVTLENPGTPVADSDGGFTQTWTTLIPSPVSASITPATVRDLEKLAAGTVLSLATHVIRMWHHPQVTTQTRITFGTRQFSVTGVMNPEERNVETVLAAAEIVT